MFPLLDPLVNAPVNLRLAARRRYDTQPISAERTWEARAESGARWSPYALAQLHALAQLPRARVSVNGMLQAASIAAAQGMNAVRAYWQGKNAGAPDGIEAPANCPGTLPLEDAARPAEDKPDLSKPFRLLELPEHLLDDIAERSGNASALLFVNRRMLGNAKLFELASVETLVRLSNSLAATEDAGLSPLDLRTRRQKAVMPYHARLSYFVNTLGMPPAADGSGGSGALGVRSETSRQTVLDNLQKAASLFGYTDRDVDGRTLGPLPELFGPRNHASKPSMESIYGTLAGHAQYPEDFISLLGKAPDRDGFGGIGIRGLPTAEQVEPLRTLCGRAAMNYGLGIGPLLPHFAETIIATGDMQAMFELAKLCTRDSDPGPLQAWHLLHEACTTSPVQHLRPLLQLADGLRNLPKADGERERAVAAQFQAWEAMGQQAKELTHVRADPLADDDWSALRFKKVTASDVENWALAMAGALPKWSPATARERARVEAVLTAFGASVSSFRKKCFRIDLWD